MTKLILIRHGQTIWNKLGKYQGQADIELSEEGMAQAEKLGANFPVDKVAAVYASSLKRAMATGDAVARRFGLETAACRELMEISFGDWEGMTYEEINAVWPSVHDGLFCRPDITACPNGEGFAGVQKRAVAKLQELVKKHQGETFVIAAHGGVNRTLLCHALGLPLRYMWNIRQDNTAVNVISFYDDGRITVDLMNSVEHLNK
ncbi:MAG: histidine phosphatase family protein [Anaerovibrio sp.]|nr:histidine phosphatase family protein [Anaerovibrio sp.]